jgi:hypothetical protein
MEVCAMRRRTLCLGLGALGLDALLASCGRSGRGSQPPVLSADPPARLGALSAGEIARDLLAARPQGAAVPAGLAFGGVHREREPTGSIAIAYYFTPGYHRLAYYAHDSVGAAERRYAAAAAELRANTRGAARNTTTVPYPATLLAYDDRGVAAIHIGSVVASVIATDSNERHFTALVIAAVAHLQRVFV